MSTEANITVSPNPNNPSVQVVNVSGELDESNLSEFETVVNPLIQDANNQTIIFNFGGLEFMSSKIIGYLTSIYTTMQRSQRTVILAAYNQTIADILTLVGFDQLMTHYATLEEALRATAQPAVPPAISQDVSQSSNESITLPQ